MENTIFSNLGMHVTNLSRQFPNTLPMLSKKVHAMTPFFNLQTYSDSNEANLLFDHGIINAHLCVNAETQIVHTEMDSSYTLITVPHQPDCNWQQKQTQFNFHIGCDERIIIRMTPGICFMFSGYLLSHNQEIPVKNKMAHEQCILINYATYANKRLFDNMLKSFKRQHKLIDTK